MKPSDLKYKESYKYLLRLLSSVLNNSQPPKPNRNTDWASVFYVANLHSVVGMTCYALDKLSPEDLPPKEIMKEFKDIQRSELILESNIQFETDKILKMCKARGLKVVVLKGMVLKHYYPLPNMRTMSDVDILYREEDKKQIINLFKEINYKLSMEVDNELNFLKPPFHHYEMHAYLLPPRSKAHRFFTEVWNRLEETDTAYIMSLEDQYLYMLEHLAKHIEKAGAGLRMLMDVFLFLKAEKSKLNREIVNKGLEKICLSQFEQKIISLCDSWFLSDNPDTDTPAAQFVLSSSTFGLMRNSFIQTNIRKEHNTGKKQSGIKYIVHKIFPDYLHICSRFPSARKFRVFYPFYIPAYWCLRVFKDKNINTSNFNKYFIKTDSDEAKFILKAIEDFGLDIRM